MREKEREREREREGRRGRGRGAGAAGAYRIADFPWATFPVELCIELLLFCLFYNINNICFTSWLMFPFIFANERSAE